jgi:mono/diheme cytochrome c family protein
MKITHFIRAATALATILCVSNGFAAAAADGKALYTQRCGMCHQGIGMAVGILSRRPNDPSKGFLEQRTDLSSAVIRTVVRTGINNMPRITRAEVSNAELAAIADYLARGKP